MLKTELDQPNIDSSKLGAVWPEYTSYPLVIKFKK